MRQGLGSSLGTALPALAVALAPKCPACLGAYLAIGSSLGLGKLDPGIVWGALIGVLVLALLLLARAALRRKRYVALAVAAAGAIAIVACRAFEAGHIASIAAVGLLYAGTLAIYLGRKRAPKPAHACHAERACH